jgi:hypothetical protein
LIARLQEDDAGGGEKNKWTPCPPNKTFQPKVFDDSKAGPKNCSSSSTPLDVLMLFWDNLLNRFANDIDTTIDEIEVSRKKSVEIVFIFI